VRNGSCYFRNQTPGDLWQNKGARAGTTLYIQESTGDFATFEDQNAFSGHNAAFTLKSMPGTDLEFCKKICLDNGFGGFVLWNGWCYFRKQGARDILQARESHPVAALHVRDFDTYEQQDAFPGHNAEFTMHSMPSANLDFCKQVCRDQGFGGFAVRNGSCYFRNQTPGDLWQNKGARAGTTLYIQESTGDFATFEDQNAFSGHNAAFTLKSMPGTDLEFCKKICLDNGFGGIVLWNGWWYFRRQGAPDILQARESAPQSTLYVVPT